MNRKLTLTDKMNRRTHLIQRLRNPTGQVNPFSFGGGLVNGGFSKQGMSLVGTVCSFDYMGSSEFEWGAVPEAFRFMGEQASEGNLVFGQVSNVFYICPSQYESGVKEVIEKLLVDEYSFRLREHCGLKDYFSGKNEFNRDIVGWVELDNGFMFFTDETMFDNMKKLYGLSE